MPILSLVTYAIGPSIAKAILKLWLKDQSILPDVIPDLLDLLKSAAQGERDAHQAARRIEDLGVQVVQQLQPVFDDAGPSVGDTSHATVAQELATTLAAARIQPRLLIECNLDPALLTRHLKNTRLDAAKLLSTAEESLYQRLLAESARSITEIATGLQGFDTAYTAASLQDNDKILAMVSAIWQRPAQADQEFEDKYRDQVKNHLDKLELFGLPKMDATTRVQRLTHVYITLQFEQHMHTTNWKVSGDQQLLTSLFKDLNEVPLNSAGAVRKPADHLLPQKGDIDQILAFSRRLVIRGDAGSGKSTLLRWLAVRSASRSFTGMLAGWNNTIPFFILLRERVDHDFPTPEEYPKLIAKTIAGTMPPSWVHRQLESGRALVLVDGVDELPQTKREGLLQALSELITSYPLARYLVTSRPAALKHDDWPDWSEWTTAEGFVDATLQPMTPDQVNQLIHQWHAALVEKVTDPEDQEEISHLPTRLLRTLRLRPALRRLTANPLLCAMICALHRDSRENLPSERLKLYEQCVEMLLNKRDEGRRVQLGPEYARLTPGQQRTLVENFAYWMMRNNYSDVSVKEADEQFAEKLPHISAPDADGVKVRRYFVERTSLLREPIDGRIGFAHRTFEEYLAAHQAVKENDFGLLRDKATDDQWRELIILAAGAARPKEAAKFLPRLIKRAQDLKRDPLRHRVLLLAVACLETCVDLDPTVRAYVIEQARSIFPPKDDDEVRLVSAAGDPAIQLLAYNPQHTTAESVACVRALAQIGSAAAMHAIAAYLAPPDPEVREAIVASWDLFDRAEYARHVLAKSDTLVLPVLTSWEGFEDLRHLNALAVIALAPDVDLTPLRQLTVLTTFSFGPLLSREFKISSLLQSNVQRQRILQAQHEEVASTETRSQITAPITHDLTPVVGLQVLKSLSLSGDAISDLTPLAALTQLSQLDLDGAAISDLTPLAALAQLKILLLFRTKHLDSLQIAKLQAALPQLEILNL
jgi:hypothetical protein